MTASKVRLTLVSFLLLTGMLDAAEIYVPDHYTTIQGAINAAVDGDTVIVRPGTYVENVNISGKALTLRSEEGPLSTIIDGGNPLNPDYGCVVYFGRGIEPDTILDGFTLTNGTGYYNPGIGTTGGGICLSESSPTIINNIIMGNSVTNNGGGIRCFVSTNPVIMNNIIRDNVALYRGGGLSSYVITLSATVMNNVIYGNSAELGGGIHCGWGTGWFTNNTIFGNSAWNKGGGVYIDNEQHLALSNSIIWNNTAPTGNEIALGIKYGVTTLDISYSDVRGGQSAVFVDVGCALNWGSGMIDADPLFADSASNDFHLTWTSPCRDSGDNSTVTELFDFEGDPRIHDSTVDMGADEFHFHLYHMGDVVPGGSIDMKVVGPPGVSPVRLALGSGIQDPPQPTPFGDLYLTLPPYFMTDLGTIPSEGVLVCPGTVPTFWNPGEGKPFQALVGPLGNPGTKLTNLLVLPVE